jgi:hypothetical protein
MPSSKLFLVSYDLNRPRAEDAYPDLINALKRDGAVKVLYSEWLVQSTGPAVAVANRYLVHIDRNDSLFVCEVHDAAWFNLMNPVPATGMLNAAAA